MQDNDVEFLFCIKRSELLGRTDHRGLHRTRHVGRVKLHCIALVRVGLGLRGHHRIGRGVFRIYFVMFVLIRKLALDNAEEFVGHLQEDWEGAFLQVHVQDVGFALHGLRLSVRAADCFTADGLPAAVLVRSSRGTSFAGLALLGA